MLQELPLTPREDLQDSDCLAGNLLANICSWILMRWKSPEVVSMKNWPQIQNMSAALIVFKDIYLCDSCSAPQDLACILHGIMHICTHCAHHARTHTHCLCNSLWHFHNQHDYWNIIFVHFTSRPLRIHQYKFVMPRHIPSHNHYFTFVLCHQGVPHSRNHLFGWHSYLLHTHSCIIHSFFKGVISTCEGDMKVGKQFLLQHLHTSNLILLKLKLCSTEWGRH